MRSSRPIAETRPAGPFAATHPGDMLTPNQAAGILTLDVTTVYAKMRAGEIPFIDLAKRAKRIRRSDLEAFIESRLRGAESRGSELASAPPAPGLADYWSRPTSARQARTGAAR